MDLAAVGSDGGMTVKRRSRCPYCGELFWPDPRTAWRQKTCSDPLCQAQRRRDTQSRYRKKNRGDQEARRYRDAIAKAKSGEPGEISVPQTASIRESLVWDEIKDEMKPQDYVTIAFIVKLLVCAMRVEIIGQPSVINKEIGNYRLVEGKDETAMSPSPP